MKSSVNRRRLIVDVSIAIVVLFIIVFFNSSEKSISHSQPLKPVIPEIANTLPSNSLTYSELPSGFLPGPPIESEVKAPKNKSLSVSLPAFPLVAPLPAFKINPIVKTVEAGAGEFITTKDRSVIQLPPDAFVDANGNRVSGKVDVSIREFHNTWDMFASGIPMHYDSGGFDQLESAGMIEINASQNGQAVFPNPQKQLNVLMASKNKDDLFNIYFYNKKNNQWTYQKKNTFITEDVSDRRYPSKKRDELYYPEVKYYSYIASTTNMKAKRNFILGSKQRPDHFIFRFPPRVKTFPELKALRSIHWVYKGEDAPQLFDLLFENNKAKNVANVVAATDLKLIKNDSDYVLSFLINDYPVRINITPYVESYNDKKNADVAYNKYVTKKNNRIADEKKHFEAFQRDTAEKKSITNAVAENRSGNLMRMFSINNFGLWNVDKPFKVNLPVQVNAEFIDENGNPLTINTGYMVVKDKNSVVVIDNVKKFKFNPESSNLFWAVMSDNRIAIISPEEFQRHYGQRGKVKFQVKVFDDLAKSKEELKKEMAEMKRISV